MKNKYNNSCKNCKHGEIDEKYHGYTHCKLFDASFRSDSKCKKHIKED